MKVRKFYPAQVLRRLPGSDQVVDPGERVAVQFHMRLGVKKGKALIADLEGLREQVKERLRQSLSERAQS